MQTVECDACGCCVERKDECPVCHEPLPRAAKTIRRVSVVQAGARAWTLRVALLMATGLAVRHHGVLVMICVAMLVAGGVSFCTSLHTHGAHR